jgi:hypothetical protein
MTGHFLLPRPVARRPALGRSAARGVSTGVTSRGTPGRARKVGQTVYAQVQRRIQVPVQLQPARRAAEERLRWTGRGRRTGRRREKAAMSFSSRVRRWHEDGDARR